MSRLRENPVKENIDMKKIRVKIEIEEIENGKKHKREFEEFIDSEAEIEEMLDFFENG